MTPKVTAKQNPGLQDDHDPNDIGRRMESEEVLPQGYDAQRGGIKSGQMDEHQHIPNVKRDLPKKNPMDVPGLHSDREGLPIDAAIKKDC